MSEVIGWYEDVDKFGEWYCAICDTGGRGRRAAFNRHYDTTHHEQGEEQGA